MPLGTEVGLGASHVLCLMGTQIPTESGTAASHFAVLLLSSSTCKRSPSARRPETGNVADACAHVISHAGLYLYDT